MSGAPVVIATNGYGMAVRPVDSGAPVLTVAENGFGMPIVISDLGAPFVVEGLEPSSYLGPVATRTNVLAGFNATNKQMSSRTAHRASVNITSLKLALPNWYIANGTFAETGSGADATITCSIEYPAGMFTQVTFTGSPTGTIPNGQTLLSDFVSVSIPKNAWFWVRYFWNCTAGIVYNGQAPASDAAAGDAMQYAASGLTDATMGGTITRQDGNIYTCAAILGMTTENTFALIGDSRTRGQADLTPDPAYYEHGILNRTVGKIHGYVGFGRVGIPLFAFVANSVRQRELAAYCSHIVGANGTNDAVTNNRSLADMQSNLTAFVNLFPGKPVDYTTLAPSSTGAWTLVDGSDQTPRSPNTTVINGFNDWLRTVPAGLRRVFDVSDVLSSSRNSGKWKADGTVGKWTADGLHESSYACAQVEASGVINPF